MNDCIKTWQQMLLTQCHGKITVLVISTQTRGPSVQNRWSKRACCFGRRCFLDHAVSLMRPKMSPIHDKNLPSRKTIILCWRRRGRALFVVKSSKNNFFRESKQAAFRHVESLYLSLSTRGLCNIFRHEPLHLKHI